MSTTPKEPVGGQSLNLPKSHVSETPLPQLKVDRAAQSALIKKMMDRADNSLIGREFKMWAKEYDRTMCRMLRLSAQGDAPEQVYADTEHLRLLGRVLRSFAKAGGYSLEGIMTIGIQIETTMLPSDRQIEQAAREEGILLVDGDEQPASTETPVSEEHPPVKPSQELAEAHA